MLFKIANRNQKNPKKGGEKEMRLRGLLTLSVIGLLVLLPVAAYATVGNPSHTADPGSAGSTQIIDIYYTYDSLGRLTGQRQTIHEEGTALDGSSYVSDTTIEYTVIGGVAKASGSVSTTTKNWVDGSTETTTTTINYQYDASGRLTGASGTRTVSGTSAEYEDEEGNYHASEQYTGSFTLTFSIISGQAVVTSETGSITYSVYNEDTGQYEENRTSTITTTYTYEMIAGSLKVVESVTTNNTVYVETDDQGNHLWTQSTITTTYEYSATGALLSAHGTGTGSGYLLTENGYQSYTSTISVDYDIINGVARQTHYHEERTFVPNQAPANRDPAVRGQIEGVYYVASGVNNLGEKNYYVYIVVSADAFDDVAGDGEYQELDGDYFLVRVSVGNSEQRAKDLVSQYSGKVGQTMTFFGNTLPGRAIEFLGVGNGGFDIP